MGQAVLTYLGVILGAAIAGGVSLWREQVVTARERVAQQAEREQRRKDVRDEFQRESLLMLQDVIEAVRRVTWRDWNRRVTLAMSSGAWEKPDFDSPQHEDWREHDMQARRMRARVFDSQLRSLLEQFREASWATVAAPAMQEATEQMNFTNRLAREVEDRIAELLPQLY